MNSFHKFLLSVCTLVFPLKIYGRDNIPDGKAVFVCNHLSAVDIGIVSKAYKGKDMFFLAKKEVFKNKILSKIAVDFGAISIDRENPDIKSLMQASKALKEGHKLLIFPEGTRNKVNNELQELKGGSVVFAVKAKCPVIPMFIEKHPRPFRRINFIIGKPFYFDEFYDKKLDDETIKQMEEKLREKLLAEQENLRVILENEKNKKKKVKKNKDDIN